MKKSLSFKKALEKSKISSQLSLDLDIENTVILNPASSKEELDYLHLRCGTRASNSTKKHRRIR